MTEYKTPYQSPSIQHHIDNIAYHIKNAIEAIEYIEGAIFSDESQILTSGKKVLEMTSKNVVKSAEREWKKKQNTPIMDDFEDLAEEISQLTGVHDGGGVESVMLKGIKE